MVNCTEPFPFGKASLNTLLLLLQGASDEVFRRNKSVPGKLRGLHPGTNVIQLFTAVFFRNKLVFVPGKLFPTRLVFTVKGGAYPSETPFCFSTQGVGTALLSNIRLEWKFLPGTNTLPYYEHLYITVVKSYTTLTLGPHFAMSGR